MTVRFSPQEAIQVDQYLKENPLFDGFSALARIATLTFIGEERRFHLLPVESGSKKKGPYFLWDYDLSEAQIREILGQRGLSNEKRWLIGRILAEARFEDVMKYLTVKEIRKALPKVRLLPKVKERWEYAIQLWTKNE